MSPITESRSPEYVLSSTCDFLSGVLGNSSLYCFSEMIVMAAPVSSSMVSGEPFIDRGTVIGGVLPPPTVCSGRYSVSSSDSWSSEVVTYFMLRLRLLGFLGGADLFRHC